MAMFMIYSKGTRAKVRLGRRRAGKWAIRLRQRRPVSERFAGTPGPPPRSSAEVCATLCWRRAVDPSAPSAKEEARLIDCVRANNLRDRQCFFQSSSDHGHSSLRHAFLIEAVFVGTAGVVVPLPSDRRAQGKDFIGIPASGPQSFVDILDHVHGRDAYQFEVVRVGAPGNQDVDLTKLGVRNT